MPTLTPQQLRERYKKLPKDVQDAYFSIDTAEILQKIAKENKLTVEKIGILADETGLLMLGITHPNEFIPNLAKRLDVEKEVARKIAQKINSEVFSKIRASLKKIHETPGSQEETPSSTKAMEGKQKIPRIIKPQSIISEAKTNLETEFPSEEIPGKDIVAERTKDQVFRSKPSETLVTENKPEESNPEKAKKPKTQYPRGVDPYREPIE
jgi:predicted RNA-binding protein with RPS1 domain